MLRKIPATHVILVWFMQRIRIINMKTHNQYIALYPIPPESERLIVGTIHPKNHAQFLLPFFYGNRASLWKIFAEAFPDELKDPTDLKCVLKFLKLRKLAISDTILSCKRHTNSAFDRDLFDIQLHTDLLSQIRSSAIKQIYFTSGCATNGAYRLFYSGMLGLKISSQMCTNRKVMLPKSHFGREVELRILLSPSGSSNIAIAQMPEYKARRTHYAQFDRPVHRFRVDYYRKEFE